MFIYLSVCLSVDRFFQHDAVTVMKLYFFVVEINMKAKCVDGKMSKGATTRVVIIAWQVTITQYQSFLSTPVQLVLVHSLYLCLSLDRCFFTTMQAVVRKT